MNNELFSRLKGLAQKENRARLAVLLGAAAMLLILLSELFTPSGKTAAASAASADDSIYRQQLEQQLSDLIAQVEGAGRTTSDHMQDVDIWKSVVRINSNSPEVARSLRRLLMLCWSNGFPQPPTMALMPFLG